MAQVVLDPDVKHVVFHMMRRVALRVAKTKLETLGHTPSREIVEAWADVYTASRDDMSKLIVDLLTSRPPGIDPPLMVQSLAAILGCSHESLDGPTNRPCS